MKNRDTPGEQVCIYRHQYSTEFNMPHYRHARLPRRQYSGYASSITPICQFIRRAAHGVAASRAEIRQYDSIFLAAAPRAYRGDCRSLITVVIISRP